MSKGNHIRIGVLGAASIAKRSIIPAIRTLTSHYKLIGIARREIGTSNDSLASLDIPLFEGYHALIDRDLVDAVYIPLPNALHYEWVKRSLESGIHVLVEKSLACSYDEVVELNEIARSNNLALVENFQFRFHSQLAYIQELLQKGTLGELRIVRSTFCFPPFPNGDNIRYQQALGGGALLDAGAYPVKISQLILGDELEVTAATLNSNDELGVDIWGGAYIKQKKGRLFSQIAFGFDHYYQCNLEVVGTKGKLYTNRIFTAGENVNPVIIVETQGDGLQEVALRSDNHFRSMLLYFYDMIFGDKEKEQEYVANISQSRLLNEIREKSNG